METRETSLNKPTVLIGKNIKSLIKKCVAFITLQNGHKLIIAPCCASLPETAKIPAFSENTYDKFF